MIASAPEASPSRGGLGGKRDRQANLLARFFRGVVSSAKDKLRKPDGPITRAIFHDYRCFAISCNPIFKPTQALVSAKRPEQLAQADRATRARVPCRSCRHRYRIGLRSFRARS